MCIGLYLMVSAYMGYPGRFLRTKIRELIEAAKWHTWRSRQMQEAKDRLLSMVYVPQASSGSAKKHEDKAKSNATKRVEEAASNAAEDAPIGTSVAQDSLEVPVTSAARDDTEKKDKRQKRNKRIDRLTRQAADPSSRLVTRDVNTTQLTREGAHLLDAGGHVADEIVPPPQRSEVKHTDTKVRGNWEKNPNSEKLIQKATRFPIVDRQITRTIDHLTTSRPKISGPEEQVDIIRKWFEVDLEYASGFKKGLNRFIEDLADQIQRYGSACVIKQRTRSSIAQTYKDPITGGNRLPVQGYAIPDMSTMQAFIDKRGNPKKWRQDPHLFTEKAKAKEYLARDVFVPRLPSRNSAMYFWTPSIVMPVLYAVEVLRDLHDSIESHTNNVVDIPTYFQVGDKDHNNGQVTRTMLDTVSRRVSETPRGHMLFIPHFVEPHKFESQEYVEELTEAAAFWERIVRRGVGGTQLDDGEGGKANKATADVLDERGMRSAQALVPEIQRTARWLFIDKLLEKGIGIEEILSHEEMATIVFEDIDISKQMARESHVIFKWQNDAMSHGRMCRELGYIPDEERKDMYYSDIQKEVQKQVDRNKAETQAKVRPGGKPQPKRKNDSAESVRDRGPIV